MSDHEPLLSASSSYQLSAERATKHQTVLSHARPGSRRIVRLCLLVQFLQSFAECIISPARFSLLERTVCQAYYREHAPLLATSSDVRFEDPCKLASIQATISNLRGWQVSLSAVPALLFCIPLGHYSDKRGRKPVLMAALVGWIFSEGWPHFVFACSPNIAPSLILLSPIFLCFGAGTAMFDAAVTTVLTDVVDGEKRTRAFYWFLVSFQAAEILGTFCAGFLIPLSPWLPSFVGLCAALSCVLVIQSLPETKGNPPEQSRDAVVPDFARHVLTCLNNKTTIFALWVFSLSEIRGVLVEIVLQYASKTFGYKISQVAYLLTLMSVTTLLVYGVLLPGLRSWMEKRWPISAIRWDFYVSLTTAFAMTTGASLAGIAGTISMHAIALLVYASGTGLKMSWLSFLLAQTPSDDTALMCSIVSMVVTMGTIAFAPLLQSGLAASFTANWAPGGLPFFEASCFYGIACLVIVLVATKRAPMPEASEALVGPLPDDSQQRAAYS